jgi:hypothetical protein
MVIKCKGMHTGVAPMMTVDDKGNSTYNKEIEIRKLENLRQISDLEDEFYGRKRIEHTLEESNEFASHQRDEWQKIVEDVSNSTDAQQDKNKVLNDFKIQQQEDYNTFWGTEKTKKTSDEISRHEHEISTLKQEFSRYLRELKGVDEYYYNSKKEIATIYWNHIAVMLSALIQNVKPATASNIRDVLVKAEMINSEQANCVRIVANEQDNCIVSAIINLLTGIQQFKNEFSYKTELDADDVHLAGSIILNNKFHANIINDDYQELDDDDEDNTFPVDNAGSFPVDRISREDDDDEDVDTYGDDTEDIYTKNPYFSFNENNSKRLIGGKGGMQIGSSGDLAKIEQQLLLLGVTDSKELSIVVMKTLKSIKNSNISSKIKQNRIKFFATIR